MGPDSLDEFEVDGMTVKIEFDQGPSEYPFEYDEAVQFILFDRNSTISARHSFDAPEEALEFAEAAGLETFPLYRYEHGNVSYRTSPFSCRWDSGQVGFVFVKRADVGDVEKTLKTSCEILTDWCNGEIYGWVVEDPDGEQLDSCWGYYGSDMDYCKREARDNAVSNARQYWDKAWTAQAAEIEAARPDMYGGTA